MVSGPEHLRRLHHVGITVADVDRSLAFWEAFLGVAARWHRVLDGPYLQGVTGYPGVTIDAALIDLPGGGLLEILDYRVDDKVPNPDATANPGNVHICLQVDDIEAMFTRAVDAGARPVSPGPTSITRGPNTGAKACYLRDPDGITIEMFQPPPEAGSPG